MDIRARSASIIPNKGTAIAEELREIKRQLFGDGRAAFTCTFSPDLAALLPRFNIDIDDPFELPQLREKAYIRLVHRKWGRLWVCYVLAWDEANGHLLVLDRRMGLFDRTPSLGYLAQVHEEFDIDPAFEPIAVAELTRGKWRRWSD